MSARILTGTDVAALVRERVAGRVAALADVGKSVGLATIVVGDDPASHVYVAAKRKAAEAAGIRTLDHTPARRCAPGRSGAADRPSQRDERTSTGSFCSCPCPTASTSRGVAGHRPRQGRRWPASRQPGDAGDGLGRGTAPATPTGILTAARPLRHPHRGARVVVVGRSLLVGRPLAILLGLKGRDATVTLAHSRTADLAAVTRQADILVAATGWPRPHRRRSRQAGRDGDRCRYHPHRRRPGRRCRLRRRVA